MINVIQDMLSRIPGPYAICLSYHPDLPIRVTVHKYGNKEMVEDYERKIVLMALELSHWNQRRAASSLGQTIRTR